ncbi:14648_t:CDS:2, partial [Rhizophagus irregularis]
QVSIFSPILVSTFSSEHYHMSFAIGKKFSKKFLKNLEKSYRPVTNDEDIYLTYSSPNKRNNMTPSQSPSPICAANNTITDMTMEEASSTSPTHILSHSELEITSRDSQENDIHTQTPITENLTFMDEDPKEINTNKGKSPEVQTATQTNPPKSIEITVLNDIFNNTTQVSYKAHKGFIPRDKDATGGASLDFEGHKIYTMPGHLAGKTCNICGSPLHATNACDDKNFRTDNNNRKFFNKRFIDRKEEKITINETHKNRYNHIITLNSNKKNQQSKSPHNDYTRPQSTDQNTTPRSEDANLNTDKKLSHLQQNYNVLDSSLIEVTARLEKYDTIIKQLSTNITLLSQKEIASASSSLPPRPHKPSKRNTPYEKTSYEATKLKYNLRGNKQSRTSAEESETCPATEEDTDVPEESIMSDGAVFKDIITRHENIPPHDNNFTVRSKHG